MWKNRCECVQLHRSPQMWKFQRNCQIPTTTGIPISVMFHFWIDSVYVSRALDLSLFRSHTLLISFQYQWNDVNGIHLIYVFVNAEKLRIAKIPIFTLVFYFMHSRVPYILLALSDSHKKKPHQIVYYLTFIWSLVFQLDSLRCVSFWLFGFLAKIGYTAHPKGKKTRAQTNRMQSYGKFLQFIGLSEP